MKIVGAGKQYVLLLILFVCVLSGCSETIDSKTVQEVKVQNPSAQKIDKSAVDAQKEVPKSNTPTQKQPQTINPIVQEQVQEDKNDNAYHNTKNSNSEKYTEPSPRSCCKVCKKGKACGDSCINKNYECHKGSGCACDS